MKMSGRKSTVFWVNTAILTVLFILLLFVAPDVLVSGLGATLVFSLVANGATFIGGNSIDKHTISKHYKKELDTHNVEQN